MSTTRLTKTTFMLRHLILLGLMLFVPFATSLQADNHELDFREIEWRLETMPLIVDVKFTPAVQSYLNTYLVKNRDKAADIVGRSLMYFPTFEAYLAEANAPSDLKYLAVVESALHPDAFSHASARGLWQFMPSTGREYGLNISGEVDERCDPHLSTLAALEYLKRQYDRFGSWELALAAYNSGPGRVNRAIRLSGSSDFWVLQKYLPRETRNYVPAFIAAAYVIKNFQLHDIEPNYPDLDYQLTSSIKIFDELSFTEIQRLTKLPLTIIQDLNPSYKQQFVPYKSIGNWITLPTRSMPSVVGYLQHQHPDNVQGQQVPQTSLAISNLDAEEESYYFESIYMVEEEDNLYNLAQIFEVSPMSLMAWNNLTHPSITPGQELKLYLPKRYTVFSPYDDQLNQDLGLLASFPVKDHYKFRIEPPKEDSRTVAVTYKTPQGEPLPTLAMHYTELEPEKESPFELSPNGKVQTFFYHKVRSGETLSHIASKYPGVSVSKLKSWNNIGDPRRIKIGRKLRVYSNRA